MTNAFILCDLVWKVLKCYAANREGTFNKIDIMLMLKQNLKDVQFNRNVTLVTITSHVTFWCLCMPTNMKTIIFLSMGNDKHESGCSFDRCTTIGHSHLGIKLHLNNYGSYNLKVLSGLTNDCWQLIVDIWPCEVTGYTCLVICKYVLSRQKQQFLYHVLKVIYIWIINPNYLDIHTCLAQLNIN